MPPVVQLQWAPIKTENSSALKQHKAVLLGIMLKWI